MLETCWSDLKYAARVLRRSPRNTIVSVAILAVAVGANTAMFSAIDNVLFRRFPFAHTDRLLRVHDQVIATDGQQHQYNMSAAHVRRLEDHAGVFDGVVAFSGDSMTLTGGPLPERVSVVAEHDSADDTLGVPPLLGRLFNDDERRAGANAGVVLISHAMWTSRFGASPSAIGRSVTLDNRAFTIVGVMPPQYAFPYEAQFWRPLALDPADQSRDFAVFGRLRAGVTAAQTRDALRTAGDAIRALSPDTPPGYGLEWEPMRESLVGTQDAPLRALTYVVAFLLLVACVNVATLLLARAVSRRREFAIRAALGATRGRHVRQLLAETAVLAIVGCGCGVALAAWVAPLTSGLMPVVLRGQLGLATPALDWRVLAFAIAASLVSAFVAGIVPAFGSWRTSPQAALGDGGRTSSPGARQSRLLGALVIAETALTLVLLAGAGLVIRSFVRLQTMPLGFDTAHLLTMEMDLPAANDATGQARGALMRQLVDRVAATPGIRSAALTTVNPLGGGTWGATAISEEMAAHNPTAALNVNHRLVTPGLLHTMGIPLVRGRDFTSGDRVGAAPVVIVSDRLARRVWPGEDPIGKRIRMTRARSAWMTVVGVAGDVADSHDPGVPFETWYVPYDQYPTTAAAAHVFVMARTAGDPLTSVTAVRQAIVAASTSLVPYGATPMDRYYSDSLVRERLGAIFMLGFGTFGLALAALGVYGVMAFSVSQRTTEIAIRIALGARQGQIVHAVAVRAIVLVAAGVTLGLAGGAAVNRVLASILSEIAPADLAVLGGAAALILVTAAVACLLPALRAGRLDPVIALSKP